MNNNVSGIDGNTPRTHRKVLQDAGQTNVFRALLELGLRLAGPSAIQNWAIRDSIPGEYWNALVRAGFATLEELAAYAETKKAVTPPGAVG